MTSNGHLEFASCNLKPMINIEVTTRLNFFPPVQDLVHVHSRDLQVYWFHLVASGCAFPFQPPTLAWRSQCDLECEPREELTWVRRWGPSLQRSKIWHVIFEDLNIKDKYGKFDGIKSLERFPS